MTVIEIRPHRWGWKAFEAPGVEPVFPRKDQAIDYAVLDPDGMAKARRFAPEADIERPNGRPRRG